LVSLWSSFSIQRPRRGRNPIILSLRGSAVLVRQNGIVCFLHPTCYQIAPELSWEFLLETLLRWLGSTIYRSCTAPFERTILQNGIENLFLDYHPFCNGHDRANFLSCIPPSFLKTLILGSRFSGAGYERRGWVFRPFSYKMPEWVDFCFGVPCG